MDTKSEQESGGGYWIWRKGNIEALFQTVTTSFIY